MAAAAAEGAGAAAAAAAGGRTGVGVADRGNGAGGRTVGAGGGWGWKRTVGAENGGHQRTSMLRTLRNSNSQTITQPITRTTAYSHSFIPSTIRAWNDLPTEFRLSNSFKDFKKNMEDLIDPDKPDSFNSVGSKLGNILHTRLRLQASSLNAHKFAFGQASSTQCLCGHRREDNPHYFLHCPIHIEHREELFHALTLLLNQDFGHLSSVTQIDLLLNGPKGKSSTIQKTALAIQNFIFKTNRFH